MLIFELLTRFRKELLLSGSALYETVMAIAERVNRKVHVLRLHSQATHHLHAIRTLQRQIGRDVAHHLASPPESAMPRSSQALNTAISGAAGRLKQSRTHLMKIEGCIRELKAEVAHEELMVIQRDLMLRDAALERVVVAKGASILGRPLGDVAMPATARMVFVFRGPFLLLPSDSLLLRPDDIVLLAGLRADLDQLLPHFQQQRTSRTAS